MMGSHYKDWVVMQEIDPNSFLCNCTQIASERANTCDHAKLLSHASGLIKEAPVLDITDGDTLFQFPGKCFLCIAVEIDEPLSPIVALTLANRLVNGCKLITCSLCQKLYGKTVEANRDHKKILVNWRNDVGVIDKKSKKKERQGPSKEQDTSDNGVTDVQQDGPDWAVPACITMIHIDLPYSQDAKRKCTKLIQNNYLNTVKDLIPVHDEKETCKHGNQYDHRDPKEQ